MSFLRLTRGHVIALVAALLLMLATAVDWYTTDAGEVARRAERIQGEPEGPESGEISREVREASSIDAESHERNAWQPDGAIDWIVLATLLATVLGAVGAAAFRAANRTSGPPRTPAVAAAVLAMLGALLVTYRLLDRAAEPGGQIEPGAPLALVALGALAVGAAMGARAESEEGRSTSPDRRGASEAGDGTAAS